MNHWPFIVAAYAVTALLTLALLWASWSGMRRSEAEAERVGRER